MMGIYSQITKKEQMNTFLEKWPILGLEQDMYRTTLECFVIPENKPSKSSRIVSKIFQKDSRDFQ